MEGFTTAGSFLTNLFKTKSNLTALTNAFTKLEGWGIDPGFLSQLFQSGGSQLILSLAAGSETQAATAAATFGDINKLSSSLGASVAAVTPSGTSNLSTLQTQANKRLASIDEKLGNLADKIANGINGAVTKGKNKRTKKGGK